VGAGRVLELRVEERVRRAALESPAGAAPGTVTLESEAGKKKCGWGCGSSVRVAGVVMVRLEC
jgi:hypothetical protein